MSVLFTEEAIKRLPAPIVEKLQGIIARIRRLIWLKGIWMTVAGMVGALLVIMGIDGAFDIESIPVRCLLSGAGLVFTLAVTWKYLLKPLRRTVSLSMVARVVEIHHPEMQERISTAVELLASNDPASLRGSEELLQEVVKSAVTDVTDVSPEAEFSSAPILWPKRLALGALAVLLGLLVVWPFHTGILVVRALAPMLDLGSASGFELRVITKDVTVPEGEPVTILVAAKGSVPKRVEMHAQAGETAPTIERMMSEASSQVAQDETAYALHVPEAKQSFKYHVISGRARTKEYQVTVLQRPDITGLQVTYNFPAYTGLPAKIESEASGDITALAGTKVAVMAKLSGPVTKASVQYDETETTGPPVELGTDADHANAPVARWMATLDPGTNFRWRMLLTGEQEMAGRGREGVLHAIEDQAPAVVIDSPVDRDITLRPNEVLPVIYTAADDFGFSAVDLRVQMDGRGETLVSSPLPEKDPAIAQTWHGQAPLDLTKLPLRGAQTLRVRVRVSDNLPADLQGPQTAVSEEIVIHLNWGAQSFAEQSVNKQEQELRRELEKIKNDVVEERNKSEEKANQLRNREEMKSDQLQQLDKLTQKTQQTAEQLQHLAEKMEKSAFADRAEAVQQAAQEMVKPAAQALQQIPQSDSPQQRTEAAQTARNDLDQAARTLENALNNFAQDQQQAQQTAQLASLAQQEQQLADAAKNGANPEQNAAQSPAGSDQPQPTPDQQAQAQAQALQKWQEQQQQVAQNTQNFANQLKGQNPQGQQQQLQSLAQQAQSLAAQAAALAKKEDAVAAEAGQAADNSPAEAQAAQQQADVATQAQSLAAQVQQLEQQAGQALSQNGQAADHAAEAARDLQSGAQTGQEAARELGQATAQSAEGAHPAADGSPQGSEPGQPAGAPEAGSPNGTEAGQEAGAPHGDQAGQAQGSEAGSSEAGSPKAGQDPAAPALAETQASLTAAAAALQETVQALTQQAQGIGAEAQALGDATQETQLAAQAGQLAQQAGQQAGQQAAQSGQNAQQASNQAAQQGLSQHAAEPAQQAANNLALAASNAQHAMGIPHDALSSQNMGQHGSPQPGQQPGQPGQQNQLSQNPSQQPGTPTDKQGLQTTKAYNLPPELAKLGLSADDWAKIRGFVQSGSDSAEGDKVPVEYRELVKGYFRALATSAEKR